jgi:hypothetical protein
MFNTIDKVITKVFPTYSYDTTYGTDIPIREYITSQQYGIEYLIGLCEYTDHLFYLSGTTFYFVDKLTGSTSETVTDFEILEGGLDSSSPDDIISKISAKWNTEAYNSKTYQLTQANQQEDIYTGLSTGTTEEFVPRNYINSEVATVTTRKKTMYLKDSVSIKLGTVKHIQIGTVVTLSSDYASGSFIVTDKQLTKEGDEILSGLGEITYV